MSIRALALFVLLTFGIPGLASADILPTPGWPRPPPRPPRLHVERPSAFDSTDVMATLIVISLLGLAFIDDRRRSRDSSLED
jgi:hypothetical protein